MLQEGRKEGDLGLKPIELVRTLIGIFQDICSMDGLSPRRGFSFFLQGNPAFHVECLRISYVTLLIPFALFFFFKFLFLFLVSAN